MRDAPVRFAQASCFSPIETQNVDTVVHVCSEDAGLLPNDLLMAEPCVTGGLVVLISRTASSASTRRTRGCPRRSSLSKRSNLAYACPTQAVHPVLLWPGITLLVLRTRPLLGGGFCFLGSWNVVGQQGTYDFQGRVASMCSLCLQRGDVL